MQTYAKLETARHFLAAEVAAIDADLAAVNTLLWCKQNPNDPAVQHFVASITKLARYEAESPSPFMERYEAIDVEVAAYGWRRDYGEWPTKFNLEDRLAHRLDITHEDAQAVLVRTVNNPDEKVGVYGLRTAETAEAITGEDHGVPVQWNSAGETDITLYVAAEVQRAHDLAGDYDTAYLSEHLA